ncbi:MAG: hypothetical protein GX352_03535 [Clostridiales bacterium]|nr:hypothetical protein [Clostridiales bacterium]
MNSLMRILSYLFTRLTALAIIAILIVLAVFMGYDWANINVIINDGLAKRAETILMNQDTTELNKFFTQDFLSHDTILLKRPYEDYTINNYDHSIKIKKMWVWPWEDETRVFIEEIITGIEGVNKNEESKSDDIPTWKSGEGILIMEKDGRWKIGDLILTKPIATGTED